MSFRLFQKLCTIYWASKQENTQLTNKLIESHKSKPKTKLNMTVKQINIDDFLQVKNEIELDLKITEMIDSFELHDFIKECHLYTYIAAILL